MAITPDYNALPDLEIENAQTNETWLIDWVNKEIKSEKITGLEAMKQAIYLRLNTEVRKWMIYSQGYGSDIDLYFGKSLNLAKSRLKMVITDCLLNDDRIARVDNFLFSSPERNTLAVRFTVTTTAGDIVNVSQEVNVA